MGMFGVLSSMDFVQVKRVFCIFYFLNIRQENLECDNDHLILLSFFLMLWYSIDYNRRLKES